jgi:hypothetical protein
MAKRKSGVLIKSVLSGIVEEASKIRMRFF